VDPQELIENFDAIAEIYEIKHIVRACSAASSSRSNARRKRANRARSILAKRGTIKSQVD
jgi:hypothetical protein